jgi:hypothetical protein
MLGTCEFSLNWNSSMGIISHNTDFALLPALAWFCYDFVTYPFGLFSSTIIEQLNPNNTTVQNIGYGVSWLSTKAMIMVLTFSASLRRSSTAFISPVAFSAAT